MIILEEKKETQANGLSQISVTCPIILAQLSTKLLNLSNYTNGNWKLVSEEKSML